jgi:peptidoglycan/LPS O-acetylase OafA/YrhL
VISFSDGRRRGAVFSVAPTLGVLSEGRRNNLNLMRLLAAVAVIWSHAHVVSGGRQAVQPLVPEIGTDLGRVAVFVFFVISGFLISRSFERNRDLRVWLSARFLRLVPGLVVCNLFCTLLLGPAFSTLAVSEYFGDPGPYLYIVQNSTLVVLRQSLPGLFEAVPFADVTNLSLWTLFHEVSCYAMVAAVGLAGALGRDRFAVFVLGYAAFYAAALAFGDALPARIADFKSLSLPFVLGMAAYVHRDRLPLSAGLAVLLLVGLFLTPHGPLQESFVAVAVAYAALTFGFRFPGVGAWFGRFDDVSYGVYVYGFPMQQAVTALFGAMAPAAQVAIALPVAVVLATLSWRLVEGPAMRRRQALAAALPRLSMRRSTT